MKCQKCGVNEATTFIHKIVNGVEQSYQLCSGCAGGTISGDFLNPGIDVGNFLGGIFGKSKKTALGPEILRGETVCSNCGMTIEEFLNGGKLGCSDCYQAFKGRLIQPLRQIHGACEHVGKVPARTGGSLKTSRQIAKLEAELNRAVMKQDFEHAAELRDTIKSIRRDDHDVV